MSSLQQIAFQEIGETKEKTEQCLHQLREWILGQPHLKNCCRKEASIRLDDPNCEVGTKIFLIFLRNGKFDVQKSAHQIDSYLQMKWEFPHWYTGLGGRPGAVPRRTPPGATQHHPAPPNTTQLHQRKSVRRPLWLLRAHSADEAIPRRAPTPPQGQKCLPHQ